MQCTCRAYEPLRAGGQPPWPRPAHLNRSGSRSAGPRAAPSVAGMASIESVTLEVADPTAASRFYTDAFGLGTQVRLRASDAPTTGFRGFTLSLTVSQPADRQRPHRRRPRRRRHIAEAGREVALGLRRRRAGSGRDDLEGRDLGEEGHRPGHPPDRPDRAAAGRRRRGREQAVLRRPRPDRGEELRPQVRRVRHRSARSSSRSTGAAPWPRTPASPRTAPDRTGSSSARRRRAFTDPDGFAWEAAPS